MMIYDKTTGFPLGDPEIDLFPADFKPDYEKLEKSLSSLILSASGWRKIFAADGDQESSSRDLSEEGKIITLIMAEVWSVFLKRKTGKDSPLLLLGTDSRPTGGTMADAMARVFLINGIRIRYSFITAAPEIMACAGTDNDVDGFAYISASHNPLGHNGVKFGLSTGGVIGGEDAAELIEDFRRSSGDMDLIQALTERCREVSRTKLEKIYRNVSSSKKLTYEAYLKFARRVVSGMSDDEGIKFFFEKLKSDSRARGAGVLGELNGSARTLTIDRELLESSGVLWRGKNTEPGNVVHRIVPEGISLDLCRSELEKAHKEDRRFILGFVPDNDGDRGNIVYYNEKTEKAEILQAQEVFALSVIGELSWLKYLKEKYPENSDFAGKGAVAVNGPTSLRIEKIAGLLNSRVFRAETGEANVVNRAAMGRKEGFIIPILGEGSNGGNITHPAAVRDPLNTIFAILKLLYFPQLFKNWCQVTGQPDKFSDNYTLTDILETIPAFTSTSAYEDRAIMKINTSDHSKLKARYEEIFKSEWEKQKDFLESELSISGFRELNYEGTCCREGYGPEFRSGLEKGGLKIEFFDSEERVKAFIWMRGSGTEPVFRVMADIEGCNPEGEEYLLNWQREMISRADSE